MVINFRWYVRISFGMPSTAYPMVGTPVRFPMQHDVISICHGRTNRVNQREIRDRVMRLSVTVHMCAVPQRHPITRTTDREITLFMTAAEKRSLELIRANVFMCVCLSVYVCALVLHVLNAYPLNNVKSAEIKIHVQWYQ